MSAETFSTAAVRCRPFSRTVAALLVFSGSLVPVLLGWLRLYGQQLGLHGTGYGLVLMVTSALAILTGLVYWSVAALAHAAARGAGTASDQGPRMPAPPRPHRWRPA